MDDKDSPKNIFGLKINVDRVAKEFAIFCDVDKNGKKFLVFGEKVKK